MGRDGLRRSVVACQASFRRGQKTDLSGLRTLTDNLPSWSSATSERAKHLAFALYSTSTEPVPRGPALIISPFNYPFKLAIEPLCAAIAAGCPTLVIMSPASPQTAAVLRKVVGEMDKRVVEIIVGGKEEGERATSKSWGRGTLPRVSLRTRPRFADALLPLLDSRLHGID